MRRVLGGGAAVVLLSIVLRLAYGPGYVSVDGMWSLQWGSDLLAGRSLTASTGTTPHPLSTLVGAVATAFGTSGDLVLVALSYVGAALLVLGAGVLAWRLTARVATGPRAAAAFGAALLVATRPELVAATKASMLDVWAAAWLTIAVVAALPRAEARDGAAPVDGDARRRAAPPAAPGLAQGALLAAGLLRPEAWALALAWWAWRVWSDRVPHGRQLAVALAAPVLWALSDLILTGDALFAIHQTDAAAGLLREIQGIDTGVRADVLRALDGSGYAIGAPVLALLALAAVALLRRRRPDELLVLAVLVGFLGLLVAQAAGGTLIFPRFALLPAALACALVAATAVQLATRPAQGGAAAVAAVLLVVAVGVGPSLGAGGKLTTSHRASSAAQLQFTAGRDALAPGVPCGRIGTTRTGLRIYAARWTGVAIDRVHEGLTAPLPEPATYVDIDRDPSAAFLRDSRTLPPIAAPGAVPVRTSPGWQVSATCR